ncbi:imidazolonepropionase-like amidohydrolase [Spinactinospora alkalitolerans]|uniref:Imidazolonepropionase-like amidohydrolase n=2 Tax=Spinactinospora alkalitolerans TaxID=687207 RepID=A0A852TVM9_9ACTN|nr:amidohydrolase family protein [Spinactinospora alkalitolerans]NYE47761.1 imidazolonepropionase-like amidohydrolase [Spinactinospora alkalitolerans]
MTTRSALFTNANLVDPEAGTTRGDSWLLVRDGLIADHGRGEAPGADAEVIDLGGASLLPGLVDAHVHATALSADLGSVSDRSPSYVAAYAARSLTDMLHRGFTTVRDVGGGDHGLADAIADGLFDGPRLLFGGKALSQTGGHGDFRPRGRHGRDAHGCCPGAGLVCDGPIEFRRAAREQLRTGAHHVKIMLSGGVASPTDRIDSTQSADDEIRAVVEEAEAANRYVTGHAYTARAVNRGLRLGVRCIEHGNLIDESSVGLFVDNDAYLVPTLVTYRELSRQGARNGLPPESQAKVDTVLTRGLDALRLAHEAGVNLVFGTDLLGAMQAHQNEEFAIRAQVQPAPDVLRAATGTAARLLGLEGRIGTLRPGAHADLIAVEGDPLADVSVLADPEHHLRLVMRDGVVRHTRNTASQR